MYCAAVWIARSIKDYILTLLFVKYVSDKSTGSPYDGVVVPKGGSFDDMLALVGNKAIGEGMNKVIKELAWWTSLANSYAFSVTNCRIWEKAERTVM